MTKTVYVASTEALDGKGKVALDLVASLKRDGKSVGVFRPIVKSTEACEMTKALADAAGQDVATVTGVTYADIRTDADTAMTTLVSRFGAAAADKDVMVALGSDWSDVTTLGELELNAQAAAHLNAPIVLVLPGDRSDADTAAIAEVATGIVEKLHSSVLAEVTVDGADADALAKAVEGSTSTVRTALAFQHELEMMARNNIKTIVLPESADDRVLEAASIVNTRGFAKIILLGEADEIRARAAEKGWNLDGIEIVSPANEELVEKFAAKYAELRAKKGVTLEQARETLKDLSYFATMMIYFDMADGMVSGAVNTTANTIKPSFEFIKTKPGVKVVSSSFLMCMPDEVLVFGDCAVNPNPTPEELADIAVSCAKTAQRFGIEPRVAMMSYSTGTSGKGVDVDAVVEATRLAKELAPELKIEGPIQFDAAVEPSVGQKKMPGSEVAGQATVFIFPDLNTGNNTYKAVQRSANALAIGPVLQGLNKPVNDLSRGALVDDIVNTVAITAIQAQDDDATEGASK